MSIEKRRIERKEGRSLVANRGTIEYAGRMVSINGESSMIHDGMYLDDPRDKAIFVQRLQLSVGHSTSSGLQSVKEKAVELVPNRLASMSAFCIGVSAHFWQSCPT